MYYLRPSFSNPIVQFSTACQLITPQSVVSWKAPGRRCQLIVGSNTETNRWLEATVLSIGRHAIWLADSTTRLAAGHVQYRRTTNDI